MLRTLALLAHLALGLALALWVACGGSRGRRERLAQRWHRRLLAIFRIHVRVEGTPIRGAHISVANHVSWLDIPVLGALEPTRFIAKSEVSRWPVVGRLAIAAGTFFIRRGKGGARPLLERLIPHLRTAGSVVLFPEGTTSDGTGVLPFHPRLFGAALAVGCPVQPVTLQYGLAEDGASVAPFIGDDALAAHIVRLVRVRSLHVVVRYGPPLRPAGQREQLAAEAESFVRAALLAPARAPLAAAPRRPLAAAGSA